MGLDVWFPEDVTRILRAVYKARKGWTTDELEVLDAFAAGFGISMTEVLPDGAVPPATVTEARAPRQLPPG